MQNDYVDIKGNKYIKDAEKLVPGIIEKIMEHERRNDIIFYTSDIILQNIAKNGVDVINNNDKIGTIVGELNSNLNEKWGFEPYKLLKPYLEKHIRIKKSYYAIPPESLLELQEKFKGKFNIVDQIEFVGVETNICVLANAICIQSAFPDARIIIDANLCMSRDAESHYKALEVMESLGMIVRR
jgi:nicotinamidase-related amidase